MSSRTLKSYWGSSKASSLVHTTIKLSLFLMSTVLAFGQGLEDYGVKYMEELENIWDELFPSFASFIQISAYIGGMAALIFIASRIYRHLANATPIDFYPLIRPFVIGLLIFNFSTLLKITNGILRPIAEGSKQINTAQYLDLKEMIELQQMAMQETQEWKIFVGSNGNGDISEYTQTYGESDAAMIGSVVDQLSFQADKQVYIFKSKIRYIISETLRMIYQAVIMGLNTIRTFYLIVLAIIGPLILALSIFPGFGSLISTWIFKYLAVWFWLPLIHIFSYINLKIYEITLNGAFDSVAATFTDPTNMVHNVFLVVGIVGYMSVPVLSGYIFSSGNGGFGIGKAVGALGLFGAAKATSGAVSGGMHAANYANEKRKAMSTYLANKFK